MSLDGLGKFDLSNDIEKLKTLSYLNKVFKKMDETEKIFWIHKIRDALKVETTLKDIMLSWSEIKEMSENRISFGAHTVTHPILSRIPLSQAEKEILHSKYEIESKLNTKIDLFAYPNGRREDFNENIKSILKRAHFICALTTIFGVNKIGCDLFELRRGNPWEKELPIFAVKLHFYRYFT